MTMNRAMRRRLRTKKDKKAVQLLKLDLGCGKNKQKDFTGVDVEKFEGVDVIADLRLKWPWKDGTVGEVYCSHFLEHLTGAERVHFFNEMYRVMGDNSKATIVVPHWSSERAYGDPTHQWPPVCFFAFYYLSKEWRTNNAPHVGYTCDFEVNGGCSIRQDWAARSQEAQFFAQQHYINVAQDMICTLTKKGVSNAKA